VPGSNGIRAFVRRFAALVDEHAVELTELDSAIGDADHGTNMRRGAHAALEKVDSMDGASPAEILKAVAMALISKVGGASGPLYGTAFLRASAAIDGRSNLDATDVQTLFAAMLGGLRERGKASAGEKTMIDAFEPAVAALERGESLEQAYAAAKTGSDATIPLLAKKGRASYLGDRSRGHRDPGSASTVLLFQAAAETLADG
jgi:phosphoenolpyruvate---glycerone phosphotransferase subunit DhaL